MSISAKHILTTLKWLILVSAYAFLAYKLVTFDNYPYLAEHFKQANFAQYGLLLMVIGLMPLNLALEALKWRKLVAGIQPISFTFALKSVLVGQVGAFFTPNRLGDFPTRAMLLNSNHTIPAMTLGYVGSVALTLVITVAGCMALPFYLLSTKADFFSQSRASIWLIAILLIVAVGFILLLIYYKRIAQKLCASCYDWLRQLGNGLQYLRLQEWLQVIGLSAARYAVFSTQLYAMLLFMGVDITPIEALMAIPTIYLLVTYTPSFVFSDAVVRGSYAVAVLSVFSTNEAGIALASILLWTINCGLPMLAGSAIFRRSQLR